MAIAISERIGGARDWRSWVAFACVCAILYMVFIGFNPLGSKIKTIPFTGEGDILRQLWYLGTFVAILFALDVVRRPKRLLVFSGSMTLALAWCWLSLTWAIEPSVAVRRLVLTTIIMMTIFLSVERVGFGRTLFALRVMGVITIILSYIAIKVTPAAIHQFTEHGDPELIGNWRGVLAHKNYAGAVCAITILIFSFDAKRIPPWLRIVVIAAAAFFLFKTHSKTSMGLLALMFVVGWLFLAYSPKYRLLWIPGLAIALGTVGFYLLYHMQDLSDKFLGPDAFTGRVLIWERIIAFVSDHWLTGSGFGSFWNIGQDSPIFTYANGWVAELATAHNGYLDLMAQIGVPGLTLVVFSSILSPAYSLLAKPAHSRSRAALLMALLVFSIGHNFTESSLWDRDAIMQVILMFTVALIRSQTDPRGLAESASNSTGGGRIEGVATS